MVLNDVKLKSTYNYFAVTWQYNNVVIMNYCIEDKINQWLYVGGIFTEAKLNSIHFEID